MNDSRKITILAFAVGIAAFLLNTYFIFYYLYPIQLVKYPTAAEMYLNHALPPERIVDISFLYFYLNVGIKLLHVPSASLYWINIIFLSFSAALLFRVLSDFFRLPVAATGAIAFFLNRNILVYAQTFEPEILLLFFMLCFIFFALQNSTTSAALAGLFLGLAILIRPTFLPVVLAVPIYFFLQSQHQKKWLISTALFLSLSLGCLAVLWIRNIAILGYFSPYVMNPGTQFFEGSNPNSWGLGAIFPPVMNQVAEQFPHEPDYHHEVYRLFARRIAGRKLSIPESNAYWAKKGMNFLRDYPGRTAQMVLTKILHLFHDYQWNDLSTTYWNEKKLKEGRLPLIPFALLSSMALIGMLLLRSEWRKFLLLYVLFFFHFAFTLVFYVTARQRVSIIFVLILFACATFQFILEHRRRWVAVIAVIVLFVPLYTQTDLMKEESHLWQTLLDSQRYLNEAYRFRSEGKPKEATAMAALSLAAAPWLIDSRRPSNLSFEPDGFAAAAGRYARADDFSSRLDRAVWALEARKMEEAESVLQDLIDGGYRFKRDDQESSEPYFYLGRSALLRNDPAVAILRFQEAEKRSPGDPSTLAYLAALTGRTEYEHKLFRYFDEIDANFFLGRAFLEAGKAENAVGHFSYVVGKVPEYRLGLVYLAAALGKTGRLEEGIANYREAIRKSLDPVLLENEILYMFEAFTVRKPEDLFAQFSYGVVLRQFGHFNQALEVQKKILAMDPNNRQIQAEIKSLEKIIRNLQTTAKPAIPEQ